MSGRSYKARLDDLLTPLSFVRDGQDWTRVRDGMKETVNLQVSNIAGSTINLLLVDLESARLAHEITSASGEFYMERNERIGHLIDGYDHWWRRDPNGPAELTEAVRVYGLPFFDQARSLEDQAERWFGRRSKPRWHERSMIALAITLYRMGEYDEALAALDIPPPKSATPAWIARVDLVRAWLTSHPTAK